MAYDDVQEQIEMGNGFAAEELGIPYDVYRIATGFSGTKLLVPANRIATGIKVFTKVAYGTAIREDLETEKVPGILWYRVVADLRNFKVGDIFISTDPLAAGNSEVTFDTNEYNGFALASKAPVKKPIGARLNTTVQVFRDASEPDNLGRFDRAAGLQQPLIARYGKFMLGDSMEAACSIPAGLVASGKSYGSQGMSGVPGDQMKSSGWELYIPALQGFIVHEGDRVVAEDGSRYRVIVPYTQKVGASGSQWFLEREGPGV